MYQNEVIEIINYINSKYHDNVPSPIRILVKGKIQKIATFSLNELPVSLRKCTVEELVLLVQEGMRQGTVKL